MTAQSSARSLGAIAVAPSMIGAAPLGHGTEMHPALRPLSTTWAAVRTNGIPATSKRTPVAISVGCAAPITNGTVHGPATSARILIAACGISGPDVIDTITRRLLGCMAGTPAQLGTLSVNGVN